MTTANASNRFSNRVANYVRYRPGYPPDVLRCLADEFGLRAEHVAADVGSGTGIFTELLLQAGHVVFAVEPNREMRGAAEQQLAGHSGFHSVDGTAEATTLPDESVDWIVAAQAFHWFDVPRARAEAKRILRPPGFAAVLWNNRREDTPFLAAYEAVLHAFSVDYAKIKHQNAEEDGRIPLYFGGSNFARRAFVNRQPCDFDGLRGRTLSASYMPAEDHPRYPAMVDALRKVFDAHAVGGTVVIEYETCVYAGKMLAER